MNEKIKTAGILAIAASAIVASSVYVYSSVIEDNKVTKCEDTSKVTATPTAAPTASTPAFKYKDGTYTAKGDYDTAGPTHHLMEVVVTLDDDIVKAATVELKDAKISDSSKKNNDKFEAELLKTVVGKKLDEVSTVGIIAGASDTTTGFKAAVELVKTQAKN
jgi:uncharacterized protein with FMN-binding domain